jgi:hypothetical protein
MRKFLAVALVGIGTPISLIATTRPKPPVLPCLAGVWVGGSGPIPLEYLRLDLNADGTGLLTVSYLPTTPARVYKVSATRLHEYTVEIMSNPVEANSEPIKLRGEGTCSQLELIMAGAGKLKWERHMWLERLERVLARIHVVNEAAEQFKQSKHPKKQ